MAAAGTQGGDEQGLVSFDVDPASHISFEAPPLVNTFCGRGPARSSAADPSSPGWQVDPLLGLGSFSPHHTVYPPMLSKCHPSRRGYKWIVVWDPSGTYLSLPTLTREVPSIYTVYWMVRARLSLFKTRVVPLDHFYSTCLIHPHVFVQDKSIRPNQQPSFLPTCSLPSKDITYLHQPLQQLRILQHQNPW